MKQKSKKIGGYVENLSQVWSTIQGTLLPFLRSELDALTEKQERLITILEMVRVEDFAKRLGVGWRGRPLSDRRALARSFVIKAYYNMSTTRDLIERLKGNRNLRRLCGWEWAGEIPDESTFSRAFAQFAEAGLPSVVHAQLIKTYEASRLVGHLSRDSTEVDAREKAVPKPPKPPKAKRKMGRPRKGTVVEPKPMTVLERQVGMSAQEIIESLSTDCDYGSKKSSKGFQHTWRGYKLHIDSADGGIPISCILTSASVHDSQVAIPLMKMSAQRVTSLYEVMDKAYDARIIREQVTLLGHVPIIDSQKRKNAIEMDPATKQRYKVRTTAERVNARLKDDFGGRQVRVKGAHKVMTHLMFGILVLAADQLLRLVT
jgi:hypothetical protein